MYKVKTRFKKVSGLLFLIKREFQKNKSQKKQKF